MEEYNLPVIEFTHSDFKTVCFVDNVRMTGVMVRWCLSVVHAIVGRLCMRLVT